MEIPNNPYANALNGLEIADPVDAFFRFCKERENVRINRNNSVSPPWSADPIFQKGRFLNVFREDDRGTKSVLRFVDPVKSDLSKLVHALFFARWCNKAATLDALSPDRLSDSEGLLQFLQEKVEQPWCNLNAYPVESVCWAEGSFAQLEACTTLFPKIGDFLVESLTGASGDVVTATNNINAEFKMENDFPIFMAVIDLAWFRPDIIDPASHVPTGIGALPFLNRLQDYLGLSDHHETCDKMIELQKTHWPDAKRGFQPIDIEYLSCECRKYYSYVNGTKKFEGKNSFAPMDR